MGLVMGFCTPESDKGIRGIFSNLTCGDKLKFKVRAQ